MSRPEALHSLAHSYFPYCCVILTIVGAMDWVRLLINVGVAVGGCLGHVCFLLNNQLAYSPNPAADRRACRSGHRGALLSARKNCKCCLKMPPCRCRCRHPAPPVGAPLTAHSLLQIYVPRIPGVPSAYAYLPDAFGLDYEDVWLTTPDNLQLHAWLVWPQHWTPERRRQRPVLVFFQENAGNMAWRLHFLRAATRFLDCSAFIVSYRGYGLSQGVPSERGLQLDAHSALDHLLQREDIDPSRLIIMGRSLGGAGRLEKMPRVAPGWQSLLCSTLSSG